MPNLVEVTIRVNDATGPAFASVLTRAEALKAALADAGTVRLGVNISGLDSSLIALRAKMQSLGIADIADVNVQPGKITAQLQLLKRLITQQGISDLLDVNLNQGQLDEELARLKSLNETIPVKLDVSDPDVVKTLAAETIPVKFDVPENIPGLGSSENISEKFTISGLQDAEQQLAALNSALKDSDDEFLKLADDGKLTEQSMEALTSQFEGLYRQMEFVKGEYADISQELANGSGPGDAAAEIDLLNGMLKDLSGNINAAGQDISGHAEAFEALSNFAAASGKDVNDLGASLDALGAASAAAQSRLTNVTLGAQGLETAAAEVSSAVDDTSDHISKVSIVSDRKSVV